MSATYKYYLFLPVFFLLEVVFLPLVLSPQLIPDLIFLFLIFSSLHRGPQFGLRMGLCVGFVLDVLGGGGLGKLILLYGLIGCGSGLLRPWVFLDSPIAQIFVPAGLYALYVQVQRLMNFSSDEFFFQHIFEVIWYSRLWITVVVAPIAFHFYKKKFMSHHSDDMSYMKP